MKNLLVVAWMGILTLSSVFVPVEVQACCGFYSGGYSPYATPNGTPASAAVLTGSGVSPYITMPHTGSGLPTSTDPLGVLNGKYDAQYGFSNTPTSGSTVFLPPPTRYLSNTESETQNNLNQVMIALILAAVSDSGHSSSGNDGGGGSGDSGGSSPPIHIEPLATFGAEYAMTTLDRILVRDGSPATFFDWYGLLHDLAEKLASAPSGAEDAVTRDWLALVQQSLDTLLHSNAVSQAEISLQKIVFDKLGRDTNLATLWYRYSVKVREIREQLPSYRKANELQQSIEAWRDRSASVEVLKQRFDTRVEFQKTLEDIDAELQDYWNSHYSEKKDFYENYFDPLVH